MSTVTQLTSFNILIALPTPTITGPGSLNVSTDSLTNVSYTLSGLDTSITSLILGPDATGSIVHDFVNNLDGTGSFQADFTVGYTPWTLSIIGLSATSCTDEASKIVIPITTASISNTFSLVPTAPVYVDILNRLAANMPQSNFIIKREYNVPFSFNSTSFDLNVTTPGVRVVITVTRAGSPGKVESPSTYTVVPNDYKTVVKLALGKGENKISALSDISESYYVIVAANNYTTIQAGYAKQIYEGTVVDLQDQQKAVFSKTSTRISERFTTYQDILPTSRSIRTISNKMAMRSLVVDSSHEVGMLDLLAALTVSTPIFQDQNQEMVLFEPTTKPLFNNQEAFGGVEAHVWLPNLCIDRWATFVKFVSNLSCFRIVSISEGQVVIYNSNGELETHVFNQSDLACSALDALTSQNCFDNIPVNLTIRDILNIFICAAQYSLDYYVTLLNPLVDVTNEKTSLIFGGSYDPTFDGEVGFSPPNRWDNEVDQPLIVSSVSVNIVDAFMNSVPLNASTTLSLQRTAYPQGELGTFDPTISGFTTLPAVVCSSDIITVAINLASDSVDIPLMADLTNGMVLITFKYSDGTTATDSLTLDWLQAKGAFAEVEFDLNVSLPLPNTLQTYPSSLDSMGPIPSSTSGISPSCVFQNGFLVTPVDLNSSNHCIKTSWTTAHSIGTNEVSLDMYLI